MFNIWGDFCRDSLSRIRKTHMPTQRGAQCQGTERIHGGGSVGDARHKGRADAPAFVLSATSTHTYTHDTLHSLTGEMRALQTHTNTHNVDTTIHPMKVLPMRTTHGPTSARAYIS